MNIGIAKRLSKLLVLTSTLSILLFLVFDLDFHQENEILLLIFNTIFTGILPITVSIIAGHSFLHNRDSNALFMSCGMLALGISSIFTGILRFTPNSANISVTIYNCCAFVGSACHLTAAVKTRRKIVAKKSMLLIPLLAYTGTVIFILFVAIGAQKGLIPPFVRQNGFTMIRYTVLWFSVTFYFASSCEFRRQYIQQNADYLFWYAQSMLMIAIGLFGVGAATGVGTLVGWVGRAAQYIGAFFAFLSMYAVFKKTKEEGSSFAAVMEEFFSNDGSNFKNLAELTSNAVLSIDDSFHIFYANTGATVMLGCEKENLMNAPILDFLKEPYTALIKEGFFKHVAFGVNDLLRPTEISIVNRQGQTIAIEVTATYQKISDSYVCTYFMQDITERKKAERALQKALNLNTEIVESISDGFFALNSD